MYKGPSFLNYVFYVSLAFAIGLSFTFFISQSLSAVKITWPGSNNLAAAAPTPSSPSTPAPTSTSAFSKVTKIFTGWSDKAEYVDEQIFEVPTTGKVIKADLKEKKVYLFENGVLTKTLEILSVGRPGTPWETPSGKYQVLLKERNHFSSIGSVWMPYSIQFRGNYFIHGWPTYPDGTPVDAGFSGGCIRLSTVDAGEVYKFAEKNTPIFIHGAESKREDESGRHYEIRQNPSELKVSAESFLVADLETGEIILERERDKIYPFASITKLMTALVALDVIDPFTYASVSATATATYGESGGLKVGERIMVKDLIYPLLLESSNDAAEVIAERYGRERFVKAMNERAKVLELTHTTFEDPSGISPNNQSSASDLFRLLRHLYRYKNYIFEVTRTVDKFHEDHQWRNNNPFVYDSSFLGGKSGKTEAAKESFANLFAFSFERSSQGTTLASAEKENRNIAVIVLRSNDRMADTRALLNYLKYNVSYKSF